MRESIFGKVRAPENAKAIEYSRKAGYKSGGAVTPKEAVHKHEDKDHPGTTHTRLKRGGTVPGKEAAQRLDKPQRAHGGGVKHKGGHKTNIIIQTGGGQAEKQQALQQGMQMGAQKVIGALKAKMGGAGGPPGAPPGAGMPPGGAPPMGGAPPGPPPNPMGPPMRAKGGRVGTNGLSGAGTMKPAKGMLEEPAPIKVKAHMRRRGGACKE